MRISLVNKRRIYPSCKRNISYKIGAYKYNKQTIIPRVATTHKFHSHDEVVCCTLGHLGHVIFFQSHLDDHIDLFSVPITLTTSVTIGDHLVHTIWKDQDNDHPPFMLLSGRSNSLF